MEPLEEGNKGVEFVNEMVGNAIPPAFMPSCEKGFLEAAHTGNLIGHPVEVHTLLSAAHCIARADG